MNDYWDNHQESLGITDSLIQIQLPNSLDISEGAHLICTNNWTNAPSTLELVVRNLRIDEGWTPGVEVHEGDVEDLVLNLQHKSPPRDPPMMLRRVFPAKPVQMCR